MDQSRNKSRTARRQTRTAGIRAIIAAGSLAATIGGWALLSAQEAVQPGPASPVAENPPLGIALQLPSPEIPALPTLVPARPLSIDKLQLQLRTEAGTGTQAEPLTPALPSPTPTHTPPTVQRPQLRSVNPPAVPGTSRRPITTSRSSR